MMPTGNDQYLTRPRAATDGGTPPGHGRTAPGRDDADRAGRILVSNIEREAAAQRLQAAFAEHRLDDDEFHERIRRALTARTTADLGRLTADLPDAAPVLVIAGPGARAGRLALAMKSSISRLGRWTLPARFFCVVYKGSGLLDVRAARLTSDVTTIFAISYKSRTEIVLPPGVRHELGGTGVSAAGDVRALDAPATAPLIRVRGVAYRGTIEVRTSAPAPGPVR